jgi:hypothetical protein
MSKDTCLIAFKRKHWSPRILGLKNPRILDIVVFIRRLQNDSLNAQAHSHRNAAIIRICIARRDRVSISENLGTRIT